MLRNAGNSSEKWDLVHMATSCKFGNINRAFFKILSHGSGSSAADDISGETVAIKQVTRVFEKVQLAKRALREITLLRHFANHENITGLIDVDAVSPDFNEMCVHICFFIC
jgi:serine/threonine protein kinase